MRNTLAYPLLLPILGLAAATLAAPPSEPPRARSIRHEEVRHGETERDDYYWLREKANPEAIRYLDAENAYTAAVTESLKPLVETIYKEIKGRLKETDLSVPAREGAFYYYTRTEEGRQYTIHCRKAAKADGGFDEAAAEEILIDGNELAKGQKFLSIGVKAVSDDGTRLAYTTDVVGFQQFTLYFKDLATGTTAKLAERVTTLAWAADNATLFYTTEDAATKRSDTLWRLKTGGRPEKVYVENDPAFDLYVSRTRDKAFVRLLAQSFDAWETRLLDATRPAGKFRTLLARENGHKYEVEARQGMLYIRTNRGAPDFRVVTAPAADPRPEKWRPFVAGEPGTLVDDIEVFEGGAAVFEKANAQDRVRVYDFAKRAWRTVNFSEAVYAVTPVDLADFASPQVRVSFQSPVTPPTVIDIDLASGRQTVRKRQEVLGGYDASRYQTARLWATARDGAKVPLSIVWRKGTPRDGSAPMLLYGYGSYGIGMPATFRSVNISLLDRGVVYAIAHVRGGNELGEGWYEAGRLMNKKNTFNDFIDCAAAPNT